MLMSDTSLPAQRLGFYYHPSASQYRQDSLALWLPRLQSLGASWLVLPAPSSRAIPEAFLRGLVNAGIQPILQFHLPLGQAAPTTDMELLLDVYARWGVRHVVFFDRPNLRAAWPTADWPRPELVERFLDQYIPLANLALQRSLSPVFPALEPGGDFWDTLFLRAALSGLVRRGSPRLLDALILGAYAWTYQHPLDWGAGGPQRWPQARPYNTHPNLPDQRGFRIFDWYQSIAQSILGQPCPLLLLAAGCHPNSSLENLSPEAHLDVNLEIARLALGLPTPYAKIPPEVLACNFWLLSDDPQSPTAHQAWFQPEGGTLPIVETLQELITGAPDRPTQAKSLPNTAEAINHYLLLPAGCASPSQQHMPFVQKYRPTIGASPEEAAKARRVTLAGDRSAFPEHLVSELLNCGCTVDWIREDGTILATRLVPPSSAV